MKYDTEQMTFIGTAGTAEESAALALHYEIIAAAQTAAASLLDLARKIKRMRDTSGYKALGFDSLEAYTMATIGLQLHRHCRKAARAADRTERGGGCHQAGPAGPVERAGTAADCS